MSAASCWAWVRTRAESPSNCGADTPDPVALGMEARSRSISARTASGSADTALSRGVVMPSVWSRRAMTRWAGDTCGCPEAVAARTAADTACWVRVVGEKSIGAAFPVARSRAVLECSVIVRTGRG